MKALSCFLAVWALVLSHYCLCSEAQGEGKEGDSIYSYESIGDDGWLELPQKFQAYFDREQPFNSAHERIQAIVAEAGGDFLWEKASECHCLDYSDLQVSQNRRSQELAHVAGSSPPLQEMIGDNASSDCLCLSGAQVKAGREMGFDLAAACDETTCGSSSHFACTLPRHHYAQYIDIDGKYAHLTQEGACGLIARGLVTAATYISMGFCGVTGAALNSANCSSAQPWNERGQEGFSVGVKLGEVLCYLPAMGVGAASGASRLLCKGCSHGCVRPVGTVGGCALVLCYAKCKSAKPELAPIR